MKEEKRRVPKLRFPGFTEDWEQRKLGSIGSTYTGLSGKTKEDFGHGEAQYITYLNVFQNTVSDITMTDKVEIDTTQNEVKYGDVLFTTSSETPEEVGMSSVWLGVSPNTYLNSFCFGFRPNQKINPYFLGYSLRSPYMRNKIKILAQGISRYNISKNKVMELEISVPNNEEQKLLGAFLQRIDLIITLHQRKLENLKLKKKALLQKLFPRNGECYPELRFPGFTDAWEQCKLTDIAKTFIGLVTTMTENYRDSGTLLIRNSDIKEGQFIFSEKPIHLDEEFAEKNKTRRLQIGDVVTVHTGDIGTSAVIKEKEAGAIGFATINTRTDKRILNPYFLSTYFNTEKHKCYANSVSTGDGRSNYNIKDFNKLVISIPTLDEQEKISALINNINTIITLHQRKLEHLQLQKKALLQQMFV